MTTRLLAAVVALACLAGPAGANPTGLPAGGSAMTDMPADLNVGIDQSKRGTQLNLDLVFRDESEQPVTLRQAMGGRVTILVPVYFRCPMLCTKVLNGLLDGMRAFPAGFDVGATFNVVTVSMDPKEHADLGAKKKAAYVAEYGRPGADAGWRFLTGKKEAIGELLASVGYRYEFDKAFKEYNHPSGIVILTPEGKVSRYFLGIGYDDDDPDPNRPLDPAGRPVKAPTYQTLRLALVEASDGKIGSLADQITLTCYRFDGQGYSLNIRRAMQAAAVLTLLALGTGVFVALRRERRAAAAAGLAAQTSPPTGGTP
ncbi:MAG: SCO family protein [Isosphaera sp.]|nr:SCO family protein [Isosphaera sp.]